MKIKELLEKISVKRNKLDFNYKKRSDENSVSTILGKNKFEPLISRQNDIDIYSVYSIGGAKANEILKTIKGMSNIKIDPDQYNGFINRTAIFIAGRILTGKNIDIIMYPKSSSKLLKDICDRISSKYETIVFDNAFEKTPYNVFVRDNHPKITPDISKRLKQYIANAKDSGFVCLKKLKPMYRKFIGGFFEYVGKTNVKNKNIVIIDDVLTTGSSITEMLQTISEKEIAAVIGITIFKMK